MNRKFLKFLLHLLCAELNFTRLRLPAMDKNTRRIVHEIANAFNLKSKSTGSATSRYPTIYKTSRSRDLDEDTFDAIEARLTRRNFQQRTDGRGRRFGGGVRYRDGDI